MGEINMVALQKQMQEETYGYDFAAMTDGDRIEFIKWNILAATDELHEALAETGWKPWATSRHVNQEALQGELIDVWHFLMNLFIVSGMDMEAVVAAYMTKRQKNIDRQTAGYDGVSTKCPRCKKAYDDEAAICHDGDRKTGFMAWCGTDQVEASV